jgi:hypothetical protein
VAATVLDMSMSLDGFIAGPNERADNGLGDGGHRLHGWVFPDGEASPEALSDLGAVDGAGHRGAPVDRRGRRRPRDLRAGGRLGRGPPRRRADL